ncbi:metallophosphoesterase family protein [Rhizobium sp. C4]|uniref:metallophosphoesterase family protein n=1 Tax=Rhizobium sp. C4 TaxID=1349800 RepID=UPI001E6065BC|nr:metallophosphoesterase [Rhizobium sp. C4]MCD2173755.1 metallophosphoesterase [Rhizobium sp. C4]
MFRLAHISDIHLGPLPDVPLRDLLSKRITGYVNWHRNRRKHLFGNTLELLLEQMQAHAPHHVAVTGDLVNLATAIEIGNAAAWLSEVGTPFDVSVVPGNHDAYVPGAAGRAAAAWNEYMAGDADVLSEARKFPYVRRRGQVAIVGCSTAVATPPFSANGFFSAGQARRTLDLLRQLGEEGLARVVLIHHPPIRGAAPNHKRMVGIRRFAAVMREAGAELVLHGHTHLNTHYTLAGRDRPVPVIGIASASQSPGGRKPPAAFNLFEIDGEPGRWQVLHKRFALNDDARTFQLVVDEVL